MGNIALIQNIDSLDIARIDSSILKVLDTLNTLNTAIADITHTIITYQETYQEIVISFDRFLEIEKAWELSTESILRATVFITSPKESHRVFLLDSPIDEYVKYCEEQQFVYPKISGVFCSKQV